MKKLFVLFVSLLACSCVFAQDTSNYIAKTIYVLMRDADYNNAILVLSGELEKEPNNAEYKKKLGFCYYYIHDYENAKKNLLYLLKNKTGDDQCIQILGNIYRDEDQLEECKKVFTEGLQQFPDSGPLYNEMGNLLWEMHDQTAIDYWEKGIEADPNYSKNYYNACRYYHLYNQSMWSLLYGEIFVNLDPMNIKSPEIKEILINDYKKLFVALASSDSSFKEKGKFAKQFIKELNKQKSIAYTGINMNSLMAIRARFVLDWFNDNQTKFPFKLFEYHQELLREGLFEAYNQWLFGAAENINAFQIWTQNNSIDYYLFNQLQQSRIFKLPKGQYYHSPN